MALRLGLLLAAVLFSAGCASSSLRMIDAGRRQPQDAFGITATDTQLAAQLDTVIYYDGPGSWKSMAEWDEYVFTIKNHSEQPVRLSAIDLIDPMGDTIKSGSDPWKLIEETRSLEKRYRSAGIPYSTEVDPGFLNYAIGLGACAGIYMGSAAATEALWEGAFAGSAAATGAIIALPVIAVAAIPAVIISNGNMKQAIEAEFRQRQLALPRTIAPGETVSGSLFYPIVPSPGEARVIYDNSDATGATPPLPLGKGKLYRLHAGLGL